MPGSWFRSSGCPTRRSRRRGPSLAEPRSRRIRGYQAKEIEKEHAFAGASRLLGRRVLVGGTRRQPFLLEAGEPGGSLGAGFCENHRLVRIAREQAVGERGIKLRNLGVQPLHLGFHSRDAAAQGGQFRAPFGRCPPRLTARNATV